MAWHLTQAFLDTDTIEVDWSDHVLRNIYRIQEGSRLSGTSKAKKKLMLALGAPLILTRIVYYAIDAIHHLPPLAYDGTIQFFGRSNITRSPVKKRERKPKLDKDEDSTSEEEVVPLKKQMRGEVKPMPIPPRQRTPSASPIRQSPQSGLNTGAVSPSVNVDDFNDQDVLNDMIEKENEASSAQWSERRRAKEQREAKELDEKIEDGRELELLQTRTHTHTRRERERWRKVRAEFLLLLLH